MNQRNTSYQWVGTFFLTTLLLSCASTTPSKNSDGLAEIVLQKPECGATKLWGTEKKETALVKRVVDGDTIELSDGRKVRLVGVDTPETKHSKKPVQYFGKEAFAFTKESLEGQEIEMVPDQNNAATSFNDPFGRPLRYVFRKSDGLDFNAELIKRGYGFAFTKYPFERMEEFRCLGRVARESKNGQWAHSP